MILSSTFASVSNDTHVSALIDAGFSAVAIADRVGHESIDITYRYAHLFPSKQNDMADKLDSINAGYEDGAEDMSDAVDNKTHNTASCGNGISCYDKNVISIDEVGRRRAL